MTSTLCTNTSIVSVATFFQIFLEIYEGYECSLVPKPKKTTQKYLINETKQFFNFARCLEHKNDLLSSKSYGILLQIGSEIALLCSYYQTFDPQEALESKCRK